jgi:hypothetical protein
MPTLPSLPGATSGSTSNSEIQTRIDQCKIIYYRWSFQVADDNSTFGVTLPDLGSLSATQGFDISEHILEFSFQKSLDEAAGSFSLVLSNSIDWTKYLKAGEWMLAYLSSDGDLPLPSQAQTPLSGVVGSLTNTGGSVAKLGLGAASSIAPGLVSNLNDKPPLPPLGIDLTQVSDKLRGLLLIQRISVQSSLGNDGEPDIRYIVTGKDLGVCMEETDLWFNFLFQEESKFRTVVEDSSGLQQIRQLHSFMDKCFTIFFKPEDIFKNGNLAPNDFQSTLQQWLLPKQMLKDAGIAVDGDSYFGHIKAIKEFHPTLFQNVMTNPFAGLEGTAWEKLKTISQPEYHELFLELDDNGRPKLVFRPIPWAIDKSKYPNIGSYVTNYIDLANTNALSPAFQQVGNLLNAASSAISDPLNAAKGGLSNILDFSRQDYVQVDSGDIFSFDLGPDFHNRYNHFLVTANNEGPKQSTLVYSSLQSDKLADQLPFKNINSIKRHGLRKRHFSIAAFLSDNNAPLQGGPLTDTPQRTFLKEANEVMKDYWGFAEDFSSGSFNIIGLNDIKIGKVLVTDDSVDGASNMVFYIESYTDSFSLTAEGTGVWQQNLGVSRGVSLSALKNKGGFSKRTALTNVGTFVKG